MGFGKDAQDFEDNIFSGLLVGQDRMEIRLALPIPKGLATRVLQLSERMRGKRLVQGSKGTDAEYNRTVSVLIDGVIGRFENAMIRSAARRRKELGVPAPAYFLTSFEREALRSFVLWAIQEHFDEIRSGGREHILQRVSENFDE